MKERTRGESTEKRYLGPWVSREGADEGWRGRKGEQGLALVLVFAPSRVEGTEMVESQVGSFAHWWRKNTHDMSLKLDMESGRQGRGSES